MATRDMTRDGEYTQRTSMAVRRRGETKPSIMTTEFYAFIGAVAGILIAAWKLDNLNGERAWTLIAAVAIGYMVSRGLAKSGSANQKTIDRDDRD